MKTSTPDVWLRSALLASMAASLVAAEPSRQSRPNFIIIFTDDQGYHDLGCLGATKIRTPNIDRMAAEGMRFTSFYAQAVCGPSRAALMTGCYPIRVAEPANRKHQHTILHQREVTLAEVLHDAGYGTACIGKWHLGLREGSKGWNPATMPNGQGFDYFFGTPLFNGFTVRVADTKFRSPLMRNGEVVVPRVESWDGITKRYTDEAIRFLRANRDRRFFLYLAHNMPHIPLGASEQFKGRSAYGPYGDAIEEIDWSTGEILRTLRELGIDRQTLVVFTSDNGPWIETTRGNAPGGKPFIPRNHSGTADPLRGYKMVTWEGGLRVPCVMRWPGRIPAGSACDEMAATIDLFPTFARLAGAQLPADRTLDGRDISSLMLSRQGADSPHEYLYYYCYTHLQAVRDRRWKLVLPRPEHPPWVGWSGRFYGNGVDGVELYDLVEDPAERRDLAQERPAVVARLMRAVEAARKDLGDYDRIGQGARFFDKGTRRPGLWTGKRATNRRSAIRPVPYDRAPPVGNLRFDFETGDLQGWRIVEGQFELPVSDRTSLPRWKNVPFNRQGRYHLSTVALAQRDGASDRQRGVLQSPAFIIRGPRMSFLVGGGAAADTRVALFSLDDAELRSAHGANSPVMRRIVWDVSDLIGRRVVVRIIDHSAGGWGHVTFDDFSCEGELIQEP